MSHPINSKHEMLMASEQLTLISSRGPGSVVLIFGRRWRCWFTAHDGMVHVESFAEPGQGLVCRDAAMTSWTGCLRAGASSVEAAMGGVIEQYGGLIDE